MPETESVKDREQGELSSQRWSVISFERREASGLSYEDAARKLKELESRRIAGLCVVTDEAAARLPG